MKKKNILKEAGVLLIILLMFFSSATAMANTVDEQTTISTDSKSYLSTENEHKNTFDMESTAEISSEGCLQWPPPGWTIINWGGTGTWNCGAYMCAHANAPPGTGLDYAECWSDGVGYTFDCSLVTPAYDLSAAYTLPLTLEFDRNLQGYGTGRFMVNIYSGGLTLTDFEENPLDLTIDDPSGGVANVLLTFDPSGYADPSQVYVEFYYYNSNICSDCGVGIDDVHIYDFSSTPIYNQNFESGCCCDVDIDIIPFSISSPSGFPFESINVDLINNCNHQLNGIHWDITWTLGPVFPPGATLTGLSSSGQVSIQGPIGTTERVISNPLTGSSTFPCPFGFALIGVTVTADCATPLIASMKVFWTPAFLVVF